MYGYSLLQSITLDFSSALAFQEDERHLFLLHETPRPIPVDSLSLTVTPQDNKLLTSKSPDKLRSLVVSLLAGIEQCTDRLLTG
jgi:hypothetical protein